MTSSKKKKTNSEVPSGLESSMKLLNQILNDYYKEEDKKKKEEDIEK